MCAIFGANTYCDKNQLLKIGEILKHRGPDEFSYVVDEKFSFGFDRLAIVDLEKGQQPVFSKDEQIISVMNGEIYNFQELRRELEDDGFIFQSEHSDSELVPALYQKYGLDFPKFINGMFAIAIYDKHKDELLLIRDRIGRNLFITLLKTV